METKLRHLIKNLKQSNSDISDRLCNDVTYFNDSEISFWTTKYNTQLTFIKDLEQILND